MNLKNICVRTMATFVAMLMMLGNFGLLGNEISQVIAEELNNTVAPQIDANVNIEKYVQYNTNKKKRSNFKN